MRVFVCGPVVHSWTKSLYERIDDACDKLEKQGHEAVNPMKRKDCSYRNMLKDDVATMLQCDALLMLDDWERSVYCKKIRSVALNSGVLVISEDLI